MNLAMVYGRVRPEEKLLMDAASRLGIHMDTLHDRDLVLGDLPDANLLLRSVSGTRGMYVARAAEAQGRTCVNSLQTSATCADKAETSWALESHNVPTPATRVAFEIPSALQAAEQLGYPVVLKPTQGSWARLVARADNQEQLEQLLEHRAMLPNPMQHVYYLQEYVDKTAASAQQRDLRAFVVGDETIAAVWRNSDHWITNTARGATTENCPVTDDLNDLCLRAADAVGGGILAIDLMETSDGLTVHEINHTMEFRNSIQPTGVDIPGRMLQYAVNA